MDEITTGLLRRLEGLETRLRRLERIEHASGVTTAHTHAKLVASDGSPDPATDTDAAGALTAHYGLTVDNALVLSDGGELTIYAGAITVTHSRHSVDTWNDTAADDLDTINGGVDGWVLTIRSAHNDRDVTVKDATDNLYLEGDCVLNNTQDTLTLLNRGGQNWYELARSNNA